jgi:glutamate synthase domain-containing protein 3
MAELTCEGRTIREINAEIRRLLKDGEAVTVSSPGARHNLGVALLESGDVLFDGSVGYYCAGLIDGVKVRIKGSAGWGLAESMLSGEVIVEGNAGNSAGAAIRGGALVVQGDSGARTGVSMKNGLIIVTGSCGYMSGFMGQGGKMIICGDAAEAFGDSMYETICFVGGEIADLGNDAIVAESTDEDKQFLDASLTRYLPASVRANLPDGGDFKKVVSGRKLWNFKKSEWKTWEQAL